MAQSLRLDPHTFHHGSISNFYFIISPCVKAVFFADYAVYFPILQTPLLFVLETAIIKPSRKGKYLLTIDRQKRVEGDAL